MAHAMMLDLGWETVAGRIAAWLEDTLGRGEPAGRPLALPPHSATRNPDEAQRNPGYFAA